MPYLCLFQLEIKKGINIDAGYDRSIPDGGTPAKLKNLNCEKNLTQIVTKIILNCDN